MTDLNIGIIVAIGIAAIPFIYKKFRAPVIISPKQISLKAQPWKIKTTFHVQNRTKEILFDVWIKLTVEDCDIRSNNIKIDSGGGEGFLSEKISNISVDYDFIRMDGTDNKGKECLFFILYSLVPQIPQPFTIEVTSKARVEKNRNPRILLRVIRYSKAPVKLLKQNNEIAYPFTPPEAFKIKSLSLKMKRKER